MKKKRQFSTLTITILALLIVSPVNIATGDNSNLDLTDLTGITYAFTYAQLLTMPKTEVVADLYCDGALVTYGNWSGISLNYLLSQAQLTPEVSSIQFTASDGYQVAIPIDLAIQPQLIIAYELNGQPLAEGLRLVIPDANGAAWIAKITIISMSISGAAYPQAISVGNIKGDNRVETPKPTPTPSPVTQAIPIQPQPSPIENASSNIQEPTPKNATHADAPITNSQVSKQSLNPVLVYLIGIAVAISFTAVGWKVSIRKKNLRKERSTFSE